MKAKSIFFATLVLLLLWVIIPILFVKLNHLLSLPVYSFGMLRIIGLVLILSGILISLVSSLTFVRFGNGTPAITEPPKKLVVRGLYKKTRNPIYVAHVIVFFGLFVLFGHLSLLVYSVLGAFSLHQYLTKHEEPILKHRYGEEYLKYMKKVPRWI